MALFEWESKYVLDIPNVDEQHKKLVDLINLLFETRKDQSHPKEQILQTVDYLLYYTEEHFKHEEAMMKLIQYPEYRTHIKDHQNLKSKVVEFHTIIKESPDNSKNYFQLCYFLTGWLSNHILGEDNKISLFIKKNNLFHLLNS